MKVVIRTQDSNGQQAYVKLNDTPNSFTNNATLETAKVFDSPEAAVSAIQQRNAMNWGRRYDFSLVPVEVIEPKPTPRSVTRLI